MSRTSRALCALLLAAACAAPGWAERSLWVTGYYPAWRQNRLRPEDIDFGAVTHLIHFSVVPRADGTLNASVNMLAPAHVAATVAAAHAAGKKILFTVGGENTRELFEGAMSDAHRAAFVAALVKFMKDGGYDGVDVDMEDVSPRDERDYARFIRDLRAALDETTPRPLLTAAAFWQPQLFAQLSEAFDQINLMTYNLSGPYPGWVVWHNAALFDGGNRFPNGQGSLPSVDGVAETFMAAGVPRSKLGVGLTFNGYVWKGEVSRPRQAWRNPPTIRNVPYYELAQTYRITEEGPSAPGYHWDDAAGAAYISVDPAGSGDGQFVSYDDATTAARMFRYARGKGLGGLFVWDLGAGYRAEREPGKRDLLLQAVKRARLEAAAEER